MLAYNWIHMTLLLFKPGMRMVAIRLNSLVSCLITRLKISKMFEPVCFLNIVVYD